MAYIHLLARVFIVNLFGFLARWNTRLSLEAARRRVTRKLLVKRILVAAFRVAGRSVHLKKNRVPSKTVAPSACFCHLWDKQNKANRVNNNKQAAC